MIAMTDTYKYRQLNNIFLVSFSLGSTRFLKVARAKHKYVCIVIYLYLNIFIAS